MANVLYRRPPPSSQQAPQLWSSRSPLTPSHSLTPAPHLPATQLLQRASSRITASATTQPQLQTAAARSSTSTAASTAAAPPTASVAHTSSEGGSSNNNSSSTVLTVNCNLVVPYHRTNPGQQLALVGSCEALGNWDVSKGVRFTWCEGHSHVAEVELPAHCAIACKLVVLGGAAAGGSTAAGGGVVWEPEEDRELLLAPSTLAARAAGYTLLCHWGFPDCTQVLPNSLRRGGSSPSRASSSSSRGSKPAANRNGGAATPPAAAAAASPSSMTTAAAAGGNSLLAGVKRVLAQAAFKERPAAVISGSTSSWEEEPESNDHVGSFSEKKEPEEGPITTAECQVTVLLPRGCCPPLGADQSLVLVGSPAALGAWDPAGGLPLEPAAAAGEGPGGPPMWTARAELPLGQDVQAKVVIVDSLTGKAQLWEPCENRTLAPPNHHPDQHQKQHQHQHQRHQSGFISRPLMVTAYWGTAVTHVLEVDRLGVNGTASGSPQVVQQLRQQLATTSSQLDGLRRERDDARKALVTSGEQVRQLDVEVKASDRGSSSGGPPQQGRFEMVQLAQQLQTTRHLYEATKQEAAELGGAVGVTRQLCDAAKREMASLARQLEAARQAYETLAPEVERMERKLASTSRAFEDTKPELAALETQLERARSMFDRTLQKIEAAKALAASGSYDTDVVRRRNENRFQFAKF